MFTVVYLMNYFSKITVLPFQKVNYTNGHKANASCLSNAARDCCVDRTCDFHVLLVEPAHQSHRQRGQRQDSML